jgi:ABC-type nitrate/sulfonate/bicarbonate transport system ATPase subunit
MPSIITLRNVGKRFTSDEGRQVDALDGVSCTIEPGEFVCVLGPTGCGKSTLLRLIAGLEIPTHGSLHINGDQLQGVNERAGFVFQQSGLFPWLRAIDNVAFPLRMQGLAKEERYQRARQWLDSVGLADAERAYPHELSGGMAQRVALAQALITEPSILLLDEPFSALDERTRHSLEDTILQLWQKSGATVVFVTHNIEEAIYLGKCIIVMGFSPNNLVENIIIEAAYPRDRLSDGFTQHLLQIRRIFESVIQSTPTQQDTS